MELFGHAVITISGLIVLLSENILLLIQFFKLCDLFHNLAYGLSQQTFNMHLTRTFNMQLHNIVQIIYIPVDFFFII